MPNPGFISGTHHLTFCVGGAQEDYDFHVRTLGLKSVKKTVLFDGEIPIYHLYYANRVGDASTILTAFPYRQAGWMGKRGTNQAKSINVAVPAESIGYWADRLSKARHRAPRRSSASAPSGSSSPTRAASRTRSWGRPARTRASPTAAATSPPSTRSAAPTARRPPSASPSRWTTSCARRSTPSRSRSEGANHQYKLSGDGHGADPRARRGARPAAGHVALRRGHDPPPRLRRRHVREPAARQGLHRRPRLHRRLRRQGPRLLLQRLPAHAGRRAVRARLLDPQGFTIDEPEDELGTHMCIPPHWEDRRSEISQLEPIDTIETVKGRRLSGMPARILLADDDADGAASASATRSRPKGSRSSARRMTGPRRCALARALGPTCSSSTSRCPAWTGRGRRAPSATRAAALQGRRLLGRRRPSRRRRHRPLRRQGRGHPAPSRSRSLKEPSEKNALGGRNVALSGRVPRVNVTFLVVLGEPAAGSAWAGLRRHGC